MATVDQIVKRLATEDEAYEQFYPEASKPRLTTNGLSPKAVVATVMSALLGGIVALLNAVQENPDLLGGIPPWVQSLILAVTPVVLTGLATYRAKPGDVRER